MKKQSRRSESGAEASGRVTSGESLTRKIVIAFAFAIPLVVFPGSAMDNFRLPKMSLLLLEGVLLAIVVTATGYYSVVLRYSRTTAVPLLLMAAIAVWTLAGLAFSTNREVSRGTVVIAFATIAIFCSTYAVARNSGTSLLYLPLGAAVINALFICMQRFIANPFNLDPSVSKHHGETAFIGNPNDVGTYLVGPALASIALAVASRKHRRTAGSAAVVLIAGILVSQTLTAIVAFAVGLFCLTLLLDGRKAIAGAIVVVIAISGTVLLWSPLRTRISTLRDFVVAGRYNDLASGRLTPTAAAVLMAADNPVFGVGPGCFPVHYFAYKLKVERRWGHLFGNMPLNFGEAHNDHAQTLAEGGVPALVLQLAGLVMLGAAGRRARSRDVLVEKYRFAAMLSLPLAVALAVLGLAQFPLRLASTLSIYSFLAAVCLAWSFDEAK